MSSCPGNLYSSNVVPMTCIRPREGSPAWALLSQLLMALGFVLDDEEHACLVEFARGHAAGFERLESLVDPALDLRLVGVLRGAGRLRATAAGVRAAAARRRSVVRRAPSAALTRRVRRAVRRRDAVVMLLDRLELGLDRRLGRDVCGEVGIE